MAGRTEEEEEPNGEFTGSQVCSTGAAAAGCMGYGPMGQDFRSMEETGKFMLVLFLVAYRAKLTDILKVSRKRNISKEVQLHAALGVLGRLNI